MRCGYVDLPVGQVHYRRAGEAGPWVFLFHQTPLSSRMYEPTLPHLGKTCRAVAFDTPGYGGSAPPSGPTTVNDYATRLLAAIDTFTTGSFVLVGVATGCAVSLEIARLFSGHLEPEPMDFSVAFVVVGLMSLTAAPIALLMPRTAGDDLTGRGAAAPDAAITPPRPPESSPPPSPRS